MNSYQIKPQMIFRNQSGINTNRINANIANKLNTINNINKNNVKINSNTNINNIKNKNSNTSLIHYSQSLDKLFENYDIEHNIFEIFTLFILIIGIIIYIYQLVLDFYEPYNENDVRKYYESLWMICMIIILFIGFFMSYNCIYNC